MLGSIVSPTESMIGITVGFIIGLLILHGIETAIEFCINLFEAKSTRSNTLGSIDLKGIKASDGHRKKTDIPFDDIGTELNLELVEIYGHRSDSNGEKIAFEKYHIKRFYC